MLLAPNDPSNPSTPLAPTRPKTAESTVNYGVLACAAMLAVYTVFVGIGLLNGSVPLTRGYTLMSLPPLVLALWQAFGWWREVPARRDNGLLVGALGWVLAAAALWTLQTTLNAALAGGSPLESVPSSPVVWLLGALAFVLIASGAALSVRHWRELAKRDATVY